MGTRLNTKPTKMADADAAAQMELKKKRTFRKFMFRGVDLDQLLDLSSEQLMEIVHARARRRFTRGLKMKPLALMKIEEGKERSSRERETRCRQDSPPKHD